MVPIDYSYWDILEVDECVIWHPNLELLKKVVVEKAVLMLLGVIRTVISQWSKCSAKCIAVEGGYFE